MLADENVDELEEELKALMEDADPGVLPEVPCSPLGPARGMAQGGGSLLGSLPDVPTNSFNISDQQLEEELNRLTLKDSGVLSLLVLPSVRLSSDWSVVMRVFSVSPSLQTLDRRRGWSRCCEEPYGNTLGEFQRVCQSTISSNFILVKECHF